MPREGLVSTIIPVFNRPVLLHEAVSSVVAQTYRPIEIIVVDDGSTDGTPEAIAKLTAAHTEIVRSARISNGGPGVAREVGRQIAKGEFIQYLDSDDLLLPTKFERQVSGLRARPECGAAYGWTRYYSIGGSASDQPWKRTGEEIKTMFPAFLSSRWWDTSTPLYRRAVTDRAGPWLALRSEEDWEYDCRIASQCIRLHYSPAFVSDTRTHTGEMLSAAGCRRSKLRERAEAHHHILAHAQSASIGLATAEMRHFARELFLLARQCGAAGLSAEACRLFELALDASEPDRARSFDFRAYRAAASLIGWCAVGRISCTLDAIRARQNKNRFD